jgi:hypothetical protein
MFVQAGLLKRVIPNVKHRRGGETGHQFGAVCSACGERFTVCEGGGFFFHLLHCNKCGKEKSIGFKDLGEIHLRYVKGLPGPYCVASMDSDKKNPGIIFRRTP